MESDVAEQVGRGVDAGRDRALGGFVGLVALAGSLSGLQTFGIVTADAAVVLAGIVVLAAVALSLLWRSAPASAAASTATDGAADAELVVRELSGGLASLEAGDFAARIAVPLPGPYAELRGRFNDAMERTAASIADLRREAASVPAPEADEGPPEHVVDMTDSAPRIVVAKPASSRRSAKVDLFAGQMSELIALRDAGARSRPN